MNSRNLSEDRLKAKAPAGLLLLLLPSACIAAPGSPSLGSGYKRLIKITVIIVIIVLIVIIMIIVRMIVKIVILVIIVITRRTAITIVIVIVINTGYPP